MTWQAVKGSTILASVCLCSLCFPQPCLDVHGPLRQMLNHGHLHRLHSTGRDIGIWVLSQVDSLQCVTMTHRKLSVPCPRHMLNYGPVSKRSSLCQVLTYERLQWLHCTERNIGTD